MDLRRPLSTIAIAAALGGCGGGAGVPAGSMSPSPLGDVSRASTTPPAAFARMKATAAAAVEGRSIAPSQIFNWAQNNFPQFFPEHQDNRSLGGWTYREYSNGVKLGLLDGEVYVTGGPFGSTVTDVGRAADYVSPPLRLFPSSYENRQVGIAPVDRIPFGGNARALVDLEQNGTLAYIVHSLDYSENNRHLHGQVRIYRLNAGRPATEITSMLIEGSTTACLHPRKALVADFNGDGKPDVFFSCHGYDGAVHLPDDEIGEWPFVLLSQANGKYRLRKVTFGGAAPYAHAASALDTDGNGFAHIVIADAGALGRCEAPMYVLRNNKDGSFTKDTSNFRDMANCSGAAKPVWSTELIDIDGDGRYELWAAGHDIPGMRDGNGLASTVYATTGNMLFDSTPLMVLPTDASFPTPLDIAVKNGFAYFNRVSTTYEGYRIQKVDLATKVSTVMKTSFVDFGIGAYGTVCEGFGGSSIDFIRIFDNTLVTDDACRNPAIAIGR